MVVDCNVCHCKLGNRFLLICGCLYLIERSHDTENVLVARDDSELPFTTLDIISCNYFNIYNQNSPVDRTPCTVLSGKKLERCLTWNWYIAHTQSVCWTVQSAIRQRLEMIMTTVQRTGRMGGDRDALWNGTYWGPVLCRCFDASKWWLQKLFLSWFQRIRLGITTDNSSSE